MIRFGLNESISFPYFELFWTARPSELTVHSQARRSRDSSALIFLHLFNHLLMPSVFVRDWGIPRRIENVHRSRIQFWYMFTIVLCLRFFSLLFVLYAINACPFEHGMQSITFLPKRNLRIKSVSVRALSQAFEFNLFVRQVLFCSCICSHIDAIGARSFVWRCSLREIGIEY